MQRRGILRLAVQGFAAFGLVSMLAACESGPEAPAPEVVAPGGESGADPGAATPPGGVIETGASGADLVLLPPEPLEPPEPPKPAIDDDPQQLYGLDSRALGELLGEPSLVRAEAPAEIWQYRGQTCVFDVFLYDQAGGAANGQATGQASGQTGVQTGGQMGGQAGGTRVSYIEARDDAAERIDTRACLNELLRMRMGLPLG